MLADRRLQASLLEHAISPPTVLVQEKKRKAKDGAEASEAASGEEEEEEEGVEDDGNTSSGGQEKPWYVEKLAAEFRTVRRPPAYDPTHKSFAVVREECFI